jgi:hypothetical protein
MAKTKSSNLKTFLKKAKKKLGKHSKKKESKNKTSKNYKSPYKRQNR